MNRREALVSILASSTAACTRLRGIPAHFVAFDLVEAAVRLRVGHDSSVLSSMAGINRMVGAVRDGKSFVVVGRAESDGKPRGHYSLADLAAALSGTRDGGWPLVSIDRVPETETTGRLKIRIENLPPASSFANSILACDIKLKTTALNGAKDVPVASLFDVCVKSASNGVRLPDVSSRLWFTPRNASLLVRDDTIAIRHLNVGVRTELVGDTGSDELSDQFAAEFEKNLPQISARCDELQRLSGLFDLVAIASGAREIGANVDYFRDEYKQPEVHVPATYPLIRREAKIPGPSGSTRALEMEGGVNMHVLCERLRAGDHKAFRDAVLRSRPGRGVLTWRVPLEGWRLDGVPTEAGHGDRPPGIGTQIERRSTQLLQVGPSPSSPFAKPGGVLVDTPIGEDAFRRMKQ